MTAISRMIGRVATRRLDPLTNPIGAPGVGLAEISQHGLAGNRALAFRHQRPAALAI